MVAYNFNKQFANDVESGKKSQTIRKHAKSKPPKVGDALQLFTGMRTTGCRLLCRGVCTSVRRIKILPKFGEVLVMPAGQIVWLVFDSDVSLQKFAKWDGFDSVEEFFSYFEKQVDETGAFEGYLIDWEQVL